MKESKNKKAFDGKSGGSVGIGLALGLAIGLMMGVATDNIPMWMCLGISIGLCCELHSASRKRENRIPTILMTKPQSRLTPTIPTTRILTRTPTNITEQNKNTAEVLSSAVFLRLISSCLSSAGIRPRARASFHRRLAFRQA